MSVRPTHSHRRWTLVLAALLPMVAVGAAQFTTASAVGAVASTSGGWTTDATVGATAVPQGGSIKVTVTVKSTKPRTSLVDLEITDGVSTVGQTAWNQQAFTVGKTRSFTTTWTAPATARIGAYTVRVGVFGSNWTGLQHWNNGAATFTVIARSTPPTTTPTTTVPPTTVPPTTVPPTTVPPTTVPPTTVPPTTLPATTTTVRPPATTVPATTVPPTTVPPTTIPPTTIPATTIPPTTVPPTTVPPTTVPPTTAPPTTVPPTTVPPTTIPPTTVPPTTVPPTTTTTPATGHFVTLPVGAALPSEAECASRVRKAPEVRSFNSTFNQTKGAKPLAENPRVTGNFTGTTDEIIQWAACKWGIDEDIVRAQIAKESYWKQASGGDFTTDQTQCHPSLRTAAGTQCPESYGLGQVRYPYHMSAMDDSIRSSAYNLDYTYYRWRSCYDGNETWLNQFERGKDYVAGDVWGCVGLWLAGRWYTPAANDYIAAVQSYLSQRIWTTQSFITWPG